MNHVKEYHIPDMINNDQDTRYQYVCYGENDWYNWSESSWYTSYHRQHFPNVQEKRMKQK